jgi:hypothetical protein
VVAAWRDDDGCSAPSLVVRVPYQRMMEKQSGGSMEEGSKKIEK